MFASQLLRILQTVPADVNYETRVIDMPPENFTMKEYQHEISFPANGSEKEADYLAFKIDNGNVSRNASVPDCSQVLDRSSNSDDKEVADSLKLGDLEGPFNHSNGSKRGFESLIVSDQSCSSPEINHSFITNCFADNCKKGAAEESETLCTSVSEVECSSQTNLYNDQSVQECELPAVSVCYKDSDYHIVKDICVDEGLPAQDKTLIVTEKETRTGSFVSRSCVEDKDNGIAKGCNENDPSPDELEIRAGEDITKCYFHEDGTKEVDVATYLFDESKPSAEEDAIEDVMKVLVTENSEQIFEANGSTTDIRGDEPATGDRNSSQELIAQDAHSQSSNTDEIDAPRQSDEKRAILESLAVAFSSDDAKKNVAESNFLYNSKVDGGTITFVFDSSDPSLASNEAESTENSQQKSPKEYGKDKDVDENSAAIVPPRESNAEKNENVEEPKALLQAADDDPIRLHRGGGETSFASTGPVSGLITYSGPITYSGSISLRSDSSTTSTRSFAFPVLQSEWNSSPVRMVKARKHKGWRQGLLCCRF